MLIGLKEPYLGIEGCQVTILVYVLSILVDIWVIKCTCKVPSKQLFQQNNEEDNEQYQSFVFGQSSIQSFTFKFDLIASLIDPILLI
jgi:hypothetical protein